MMQSLKESVALAMAPVVERKRSANRFALQIYPQYMAGIPTEHFFFDAETHAEVCALAYEYFGLAPAGAVDVYVVVADAIGQRVVFPEFGFPDADQTDPLVQSAADLDKIRFPKAPIESGRIKFALDVPKRLSEMTGIPETNLGMCSVFTFACQICSYAGILKILKKDPGLAGEIMNRIIEDVMVPYAQTGQDYLGTKSVPFADAWDVVPNVSPKIKWGFIRDWDLVAVDRMKSIGLPAVKFEFYGEAHVADPEDMLMRKSELTPLVAASAFDYQVTGIEIFRKQAEKLGRPLMLGFDGMILTDNSPEEIIEIVRSTMKEANRGVYVMGFPLVVPVSAKPENVMTFIAAVNAFTPLPAPEDFDAIEVEVPKLPGTFSEFVRAKAEANPDNFSFKWLDSARAI